METFGHCQKHGYVKFVRNKGKYFTCGKCRSESTLKCIRDRKSRLIMEHGGKCCKCGYDKCNRSLQFHHMDSPLKENNISHIGSFDEMREESKKCILVCANCHGEIESGLIEAPSVTTWNKALKIPNRFSGHGKYVTYKNYKCRCAPCEAAGKKYMREYMRNYRNGIRIRDSKPNKNSMTIPYS